MPAVQQWGRRESIIWPPRHYLYTLGAIFLALVATGFFIYVRFQFGLSPLDVEAYLFDLKCRSAFAFQLVDLFLKAFLGFFDTSSDNVAQAGLNHMSFKDYFASRISSSPGLTRKQFCFALPVA
jgi:hypothetical protein